ncbi:hypothetical protein F5Y17DRAFT_348584 [Xylariaceae sp. FL0594]|nr:hypothetical protein F5Y17DRAFT_348584 [Xylariaceae sp. FL0594]
MVQQNENTNPPKLRGPPPGATEPPEHVKEPHIYEIFQPSSDPERPLPASPQNTLADGQARPAHPRNPTLKDGFESIKREDFLKLHQIPCAREGLLTGIGAGAVTGVGRYLTGAKAPKAANWAFGAFLLGSIIQWEYCQAQRRKERAAMARAVEIMDQRKVEKAQAAAAEAARLRKQREEEALKSQQKSWYKFW